MFNSLKNISKSVKTLILFFLNLINNQQGDYSRYIFFYLNHLIDNNKLNEARLVVEQIDYINSNIAEYIDFNVPWSINASYNLNRRKLGFRDPTITQTLTFSGDVSISEKTKISFRSGYDFKFKMLTQTSINATRDLHCWRINFSWVPFGRFQSYNLSINAVSALLQDLKLEKRSRFFDNL